MRAINWNTGVVHEAINSERNGRPVWLPACKRGRATLVAIGNDATVTCSACGGIPTSKTAPAPRTTTQPKAPAKPIIVAVNPMTGTTHKARLDRTRIDAQREDLLMQTCGTPANQRLYLTRQPEGTPITCRRCNH